MNQICIAKFCFESYMKGAEWAAWAQAVGSVLAVAGALLVFALQAKANRDLVADTQAQRLVGLWAAVACEIQACAEQAEAFLKERIGAPSYRLELPIYASVFPHLLVEARLDAKDVAALYSYFASVQAMNRGIQYAHDARDTPDHGVTFQGEAGRTMAKADLLRPGGRLYEEAMAIVSKHYPPARSWTRPVQPVKADPALMPT